MHAEPVTGNVGVKSTAERKELLDSSLQTYGEQGWRVETRSDFQATIAKRTAISYGLNVFMTIITLGLWKVVFVRSGGRRGLKRETITVDESGKIVDQAGTK